MRRFTLYMLSVLVVFSSCTKNQLAPGNIEIDFQFESLPVDLNVVDNPFITCVVRSETGLKSVQMLIQMNDGRLVPYKTDIREFFNPRHCSIHERPVYTDDMAAFVVRATDLGGQVKEGRIVLEITSKVNAPVIRLATDEIMFKEGDPIPEFGFEVSADADLNSVRVEIVQSSTSADLIPEIGDFADARNFSFISSDYDLAQYDYDKIPQAIRIVVEDDYGKSSIAVINISYRALPAPVVVMEALTGGIDEFASISLTGNAKSETGISKVEVYTVGEEYESLAGSVSNLQTNDYDITIAVPGNEVRDFITGIKVVAYDARNKKSEVLLPVVVNPVFEQIASTDDIALEIKKRFADSKYRSVKLMLPAGASYTLNEPLVISKTLKIKSSQSGNLPMINSALAYTFITNKTECDAVYFENVCFKTTKTGSFFMGNDAEECSIQSISLKGCILEGYTNSFYRTGKKAYLGTLELEDCQFSWNNTSASYSFLHIAQGGGTLSQVIVRNCTFTGVLYFHYNNLTSTQCLIDVSNCTFANTKGSEECYFLYVANQSLKGTIKLNRLLFGGDNKVVSKCRMLRAHQLSTELSDNYCTRSWKNFTDDPTNNSVNFCVLLGDEEDNAGLFADYPNNDFTIRSGTSIYEKRVGDLRWIK